jgi:hypothetical protein
LDRITEYDAVAATATTPQTVAALRRLAEQFRGLVRQRATTMNHLLAPTPPLGSVDSYLSQRTIAATRTTAR